MGSWAFRRATIDSIDALRNQVRGVADIAQLSPGRLQGTLIHAAADGFESCVVERSPVATRSVGITPGGKQVLSLVVSSSSRIAYWARDMAPGEMSVIAPGGPVEAYHEGRTSYAMLGLEPSELMASFGGEPRLRDPAFWSQRLLTLRVTSPSDAVERARRLTEILTSLREAPAPLSGDSLDFWRRSIVEIFTSLVSAAAPQERRDPVRNTARLVREIEHYLQEQVFRPVHLSEICSHLNVSRRSLHRAFEEEMGIGPVTFLRRKRLSAVHMTLRQNAQQARSVTDIALEHGFTELGRFAQYYKELFGELPSQTLHGNAGGQPEERSVLGKSSAWSLRDVQADADGADIARWTALGSRS